MFFIITMGFRETNDLFHLLGKTFLMIVAESLIPIGFGKLNTIDMSGIRCITISPDLRHYCLVSLLR